MPSLEYMIRYTRQHETKIRFLLAGGVNTVQGLANYPILYLLLSPLHVHYLVILVISQSLSITFSFITNKFFVFRTTGKHLQECGKFISFHVIHLVTNLTVLPLLVELANMNPAWAQVCYSVVVIITSYFWHSRITFRSAGA